MPSHFSDMGFDVTEENYDETVHMIFEKSRNSSNILENSDVTYVVSRVDDIMEFWFSVNNNSISSDNMEIHYSTDTFLEAGEPVWIDNSSVFSGLLRINTPEYPLNVYVPNRAMSPDFVVGKKYVVQIAAFAEEVELFDSEEDYYKSADRNDNSLINHESFIPSGMFAFDANGNIDENQQCARALINGTVIKVERKINSYTHNGYFLLKVRSFGAVYTVLLDERTFEKPVVCGNILSGSFWLTGKIIEKYAGSELASVKRLKDGNRKLQTLDDLYNIVSQCWCAETAYPSCRQDWKSSDRAYGQCAITAMLVYDMFGGTIHKVRENGGTHYFNRINGVYVDLTSEQYSYFCLFPDYKNNQTVDRQYCGKNEDTKKRYQLLIKRIADYLK